MQREGNIQYLVTYFQTLMQTNKQLFLQFFVEMLSDHGTWLFHQLLTLHGLSIPELLFDYHVLLIQFKSTSHLQKYPEIIMDCWKSYIRCENLRKPRFEDIWVNFERFLPFPGSHLLKWERESDLDLLLKATSVLPTQMQLEMSREMIQ